MSRGISKESVNASSTVLNKPSEHQQHRLRVFGLSKRLLIVGNIGCKGKHSSRDLIDLIGLKYRLFPNNGIHGNITCFSELAIFGNLLHIFFRKCWDFLWIFFIFVFLYLTFCTLFWVSL